tara:strand:+ start:65106 stop:65438 length:333 start_codon:yes stop_codon:yes gene_type:complete
MGINVKKILLSCISILILAALAIPDAVKISHAITEHKEQTCVEKGTVHFHEAEFDCDFHKYHITTYFYPQSINYTVAFQDSKIKQNQNYYFLLSEFQKLHFSLRGPPLFS